jgi:hypothetical protein
VEIHIRRIKGTPYKVVVGAGHEIIGAFDHGDYISRENMNDKLKQVIGQFRADILSERVEELSQEIS